MYIVIGVVVLAYLFRAGRFRKRRMERRLRTPPWDAAGGLDAAWRPGIPSPSPATASIGREDALWGTALLVVATTGQASPALLERRLGIDYGRAAAILAAMEAEGHIGPAKLGQSRQVFVRAEDLEKPPQQ
jgi:DNA segregation ATPase FtsK/SpoIIIE-like protein